MLDNDTYNSLEKNESMIFPGKMPKNIKNNDKMLTAKEIVQERERQD